MHDTAPMAAIALSGLLGLVWPSGKVFQVSTVPRQPRKVKAWPPLIQKKAQKLTTYINVETTMSKYYFQKQKKACFIWLQIEYRPNPVHSISANSFVAHFRQEAKVNRLRKQQQTHCEEPHLTRVDRGGEHFEKQSGALRAFKERRERRSFANEGTGRRTKPWPRPPSSGRSSGPPRDHSGQRERASSHFNGWSRQ